MNVDKWRRVHPLEFSNKYCTVWRDKDAEWMCKFDDYHKDVNLKVDSLSAALEKAEKIYPSKKYIPKPVKTRKRKLKNVPAKIKKSKKLKTK